MNLADIIARLESPHADKVYVAKDYTKADLMADLRRIDEGDGARRGAGGGVTRC